MLRKSKALKVEFCERCAQVCDAACRANVLREQVRADVLRYGGRLV